MAFPQVGLQAILDIKQFQSQQNKLQSMLTDLNKAFQKAGEGIEKQFLPPEAALRIAVARENVKTYEKALSDVVKTYAQLEKAGATKDILQQIGNEFAVQQKNLIGATKELALAEQAGQQASSGMAAGLGIITFAAVGTAAVFGTLVKVVKESTDAFIEQTTTLRELQIITGLTSIQTAALAKQARDLGLTENVVQRGVFAFYRQLESANEAMNTGVDFNNNFTRALAHLGVALRDNTGNIRPYNDILLEAFERIRALPSQYDKTAVSSQLFGRQNASLVVLLTDSTRSMEDEIEILQKLGVVAGPTATKAVRDLQASHSDLSDAWRKLKATYGESIAPVLQGFYNWLSSLIIKGTEYIANLRSQAYAIVVWADALKAGMTLREADKAFTDAYKESFEELTKGITAAQDAQEKLAIAEGNAATAAKDAADRRETAMKKEQDALKELQEARDKAFQSYQRGLDDLARSEERAAIERGLRAGWEAEDTLRRNLKRQSDINLDYQRKLEDIERGTQQKIQDQRKEQQRKLEDLERQHQMRLMQIQFAYTDAVEEALRSNDTVAILRAMRERKRALRDEELKQTEQRDQLQRDYTQRQQDQAAELQRQRDEAKRNYEQALADLQVAIQLESEEKARQGERDRILRALQHQWALEDARRQYDQQLADAQTAYEKQRAEYAQFLTDMGTQAAQGIITISNQIAAAIQTGSATVLSAEEQWLQRHFYLMSEAVNSSIGLGREQQWLQRHKYFAKGGIDVATSGAKTATYGEAGPEMAMFIPLQHSMNISHRFGNLPISLNGRSMGGVSRQEVEQIVYSLMVDLPDILRGRR